MFSISSAVALLAPTHSADAPSASAALRPGSIADGPAQLFEDYPALLPANTSQLQPTHEAPASTPAANHGTTAVSDGVDTAHARSGNTPLAPAINDSRAAQNLLVHDALANSALPPNQSAPQANNTDGTSDTTRPQDGEPAPAEPNPSNALFIAIHSEPALLRTDVVREQSAAPLSQQSHSDTGDANQTSQRPPSSQPDAQPHLSRSANPTSARLPAGSLNPLPFSNILSATRDKPQTAPVTPDHQATGQTAEQVDRATQQDSQHTPQQSRPNGQSSESGSVNLKPDRASDASQPYRQAHADERTPSESKPHFTSKDSRSQGRSNPVEPHPAAAQPASVGQHTRETTSASQVAATSAKFDAPESQSTSHVVDPAQQSPRAAAGDASRHSQSLSAGEFANQPPQQATPLASAETSPRATSPVHLAVPQNTLPEPAQIQPYLANTRTIGADSLQRPSEPHDSSTPPQPQLVKGATSQSDSILPAATQPNTVSDSTPRIAPAQTTAVSFSATPPLTENPSQTAVPPVAHSWKADSESAQPASTEPRAFAAVQGSLTPAPHASRPTPAQTQVTNDIGADSRTTQPAQEISRSDVATETVSRQPDVRTTSHVAPAAERLPHSTPRQPNPKTIARNHEATEIPSEPLPFRQTSEDLAPRKAVRRADTETLPSPAAVDTQQRPPTLSVVPNESSALFVEPPVVEVILTHDTAPHVRPDAPSHQPTTAAARTSTAASSEFYPALQETIRSEVSHHVSQANLVSENDSVRFEIQVEPPELGQLRISISESDVGVVARIVANQDGTFQLLERELPSLSQTLQQAGIEHVDVEVSHDSQHASQDPGFQRRWSRHIDEESQKSVTQQSAAQQDADSTDSNKTENHVDLIA